MSDRLALANAITDAGIERSKAERVASVIVDMVHDEVATKADLQAVQADLRAEIASVRTELRAEIAGVRTEVADLRTEMRAGDAALRTELAQMENRLLIRLGGLIVVAISAAFAALHYWPPHP